MKKQTNRMDKIGTIAMIGMLAIFWLTIVLAIFAKWIGVVCLMIVYAILNQQFSVYSQKRLKYYVFLFLIIEGIQIVPVAIIWLLH